MAGSRFLISLLVALACLTSAAAQSPDSKTSASAGCPDEASLTTQARSALVKAQQLMEKQKNALALEVLTAFVREYPDETHAYVAFTLAGLNLERGRLAEALQQYEKTLELCPAYAPAWQNLAKVCFDLKKYRRAGDALEKTWVLTGRNNHVLQFQAAAAYLSAGMSKNALPILESLCSGRAGVPQDDWVKLFAQVCIELKRPKPALTAVERLLNTHRPAPFLFRMAAALYLEVPDYRKAAQNLEAYSLMTDLTRDEQKLLADLYANIGIPARAAGKYEKLIEKAPGKSLWERFASCWLEACEYDRAFDAAQKGLASYPDSAVLWRIKGSVLYEKQDFRPAAKAFGKAFALNQKDINSLFLHGLCACRAGDQDTARKALEIAAGYHQYKAKALALMQKMGDENI